MSSDALKLRAQGIKYQFRWIALRYMLLLSVYSEAVKMLRIVGDGFLL